MEGTTWSGARLWVELLGDASSIASIVLRSLVVSGTATLLAVVIGVPIGYLLARLRFPGRRVVLGFINAGMGMPPVLVGLVVWLLLVRSGPLGQLGLIYTRTAMVLAQFAIATPLVIGFTVAAIAALPEEVHDLLDVLGAGRVHRVWLVAREARLGLLAAVMAGFGAVLSEVGAAMAVGGNLERSTRLLTTAIVTETSRGAIERAMALGVLLFAVALVVNLVLTYAQHRER